MRLMLCNDYEEMSAKGARLIAEQVMKKPDCTLGLATGSTPVGVYEKLVEMFDEGRIDFEGVTTFNLDEYYPISQNDPQSYFTFMQENFFSKVNISAENINIPNGEAKDPDEECKRYDKKLSDNGAIDLQLLGLGINGHIGINEPNGVLCIATHCTDLAESTIQANSRFFESAELVPTKALTMGIGSILSAKTIVIMASGENKHEAVSALMSTDITTEIPATILKVHPDVVLICDKEAYYG